MADFSVTTAAQARSVFGYWDDVPGVRVAGSVAAGDTINISNGPIDLGANDNILYPTAGVKIMGTGMNTASQIIGRIYVAGPNNLTTVTVLRDWWLNASGLGDMPLGNEASVSGFEDTTLILDRWKFNDSSPTGGVNAVTLWSESGGGVLMVVCDADINGAGNDCLSLKGDDLGRSRAIRLDGAYAEWGSSVNDNGWTGHDDWDTWGWGGTFTRATPAGIAIAHASNTRSAYDANFTTTGAGVNTIASGTLLNSIVDFNNGTVRGGMGSAMRWCSWKNGASGNVGSSGANPVVEDCAFTGFGALEEGILTNDITSGNAGVFRRIVAQGYRGIDLRGCAGTSLIDNSIIDTSLASGSRFPALRNGSDGAVTTTNNRVDRAGFNVPFTGTGDTIGSIAQSVIDARVAEIEAEFGRAPAPSKSALISAVENGNAAAVFNAATPEDLVTLFPKGVGGLRGLIGQGVF